MNLPDGFDPDPTEWLEAVADSPQLAMLILYNGIRQAREEKRKEEELNHATDEQVEAAIQLLREHAVIDGPHSPVSISTLLDELGEKFPIAPAVYRVVDLIYTLWEDPRIHHVDSDWIEFIWEGE